MTEEAPATPRTDERNGGPLDRIDMLSAQIDSCIVDVRRLDQHVRAEILERRKGDLEISETQGRILGELGTLRSMVGEMRELLGDWPDEIRGREGKGLMGVVAKRTSYTNEHLIGPREAPKSPVPSVPPIVRTFFARHKRAGGIVTVLFALAWAAFEVWTRL